MKRSGVADLPLHGGRVPQWLGERMTKLGTAITETIVHDYGSSAFLSRLSDPFWFQALGCVMGMDWHSSGITTSVMGALKRGLAPRANELGIYICGGRGRFSRNTPHELRVIALNTKTRSPLPSTAVPSTTTSQGGTGQDSASRTTPGSVRFFDPASFLLIDLHALLLTSLIFTLLLVTLLLTSPTEVITAT